jgi:8-oxo-dGTP diphosphatase
MTVPPPFIEVVAAVIRRHETVLLCQRHDGEHLPLLWEFPGGKIDPGESPEAALEREIGEELGVTAVVGEQVAIVEHHYPEKSVRIRFFAADIGEATPRPLVHREVRWIPPEELQAYEVPPANRSVVEMLRDGAIL